LLGSLCDKWLNYLDAILAAAYTLVASLLSGAGCGARTVGVGDKRFLRH